MVIINGDVLTSPILEKSYEKMVYVALNLQNDMSIAKLSDICCISQTSARSAIKRLQETGLIEVIARKDAFGSNIANEYRILPVPETFTTRDVEDTRAEWLRR